MKKLRKITRKYYLRQIVICWMIYSLLFFIPVRIASGATPVYTDAGGATITQGANTNVLVNQTETIVKWSNFDTMDDELVAFTQGGLTNSAVLNRISGGQTLFNGDLTGAGMRIFMINPAGIVFGSTATVNVSQLVASSLDILDSDFLNGAPYQFTGGVNAGDVINEGSIAAERIALIGRNVFNYGTLTADKYVVMAAGDELLLSENGTVAVDITSFAGWNPDAYSIYQVRNENGGSIDVGGETARVVLAAGDVWSMAYVSATSGGGSDAVATVEIKAAGDVTITDEVGADAYGDGLNNAIAAVAVNAGGDVDISAQEEDNAGLYAEAYNGKNNTATITVNAGGNVKVSAENSYSESYIYAETGTEAVEGTTNNSTVDVTAGGDVRVEAYGYDSFAGIEAEVYAGGGTNTAKTTVNADGKVVARADNGGEVDIDSEAWYGTTNTATTTINAGEYVKVKAVGEGSDAAIEAEAWEGSEKNTANLNITSTGIDDSESSRNGDVLVIAENGGTAKIAALADPEGDRESVNIANVNINAGGDVEVLAYGEYSESDLDAEALFGQSNTAGITINVGGNVLVEASGYENSADMDAVARYAASNTANVKITATDGDVKVIAEGEYSEASISAEAMNEGEVEHFADLTYIEDDSYGVEGTVQGLVNTAKVDIQAKSVEVRAEGYGSSAFIDALAANEVWLWFSDFCDVPLDLIFADVKNVAEVRITTTVDDDGDFEYNDGTSVDNGDVFVIARNGGSAGLDVEAYNKVISNEGYYAPVVLTVTGPILNNADIVINAGDDVMAIAQGEGYSDVEIDTEAWNEISYRDDVFYQFEFPVPGSGFTSLIVQGPVENSSKVDIITGDEVKVKGEYGGESYIGATAWNESVVFPEVLTDTADNTAAVAIDAGGDVKVIAINGEASISTEAQYGINNTATIGINAVGGDVKVIDIGEIYNSAKIEATATDALVSNTADVTINATAEEVTELVEVGEGEFEEITEVYGGDVKVIAKDGGHAAITAFAGQAGGLKVSQIDDGIDETSNTANVTIHATAKEVTELVEVGEGVFEEITTVYGGDVKVIGENGGKAEIEAIAKDGYTNTADVLICIDGGVKVKGENYGQAEIEAIAKDGYSNTANVGIGAKGERGIEVRAENGGEAFIGTKAKYGYTNTAKTIICTQGGVQVFDQGEIPRTAGILAEATDGTITNAYVGICAVEDVIVNAGTYYDGGGIFQLNGYDSMGGHAMIKAEAGAGRMVSSVSLDSQEPPPVPDDQEPSTANAQVVVVSHKGNVEVTAYNGGTAEILAEAYGAHTNTADVGVAAGADLSPADVALPVEEPIVEEVALVLDGLDLPLSGNVLVEAFGDSEAQILAWAHDATSIFEYPEVSGDTQELTIEPTIIPGENTARTVICAPGEVRVSAYEGGEARIKSRAGWYGEQDAINKATTRVYATDVKVYTSAYRGQGIWAWAYSENSDNPHVPGEMMIEYLGGTYDGSYYCMGEHGEIAWTDGDAVLFIQDYGKRQDCPTCPPCPCEKPVPPEEEVVVPPPPAEEIEKEVFAPVAPLPQVSIPRIEGCPGLMLATASELGIAGDTLQVAMGNALALNPSIQPCGASATLLNAAKILRDEDGSRMAAINQVFNSLAPANAPMTPETEASIAMAFAGDAAEGSQNALAKEYIDAFVQYAAVLDVQLGSPVGDSVTFVMAKYGAGITESSNRNMAAFVMSRLESAETLSK